MDPLIADCKTALATHYGAQLVDVILYGSVARGDDAPDSDVDLLVVLKEPFDYFAELRTITGLLYPLQLRSDRLLSARPASASELARGSIQLYRNAVREGVRV